MRQAPLASHGPSHPRRPGTTEAKRMPFQAPARGYAPPARSLAARTSRGLPTRSATCRTGPDGDEHMHKHRCNAASASPPNPPHPLPRVSVSPCLPRLAASSHNVRTFSGRKCLLKNPEFCGGLHLPIGTGLAGLNGDVEPRKVAKDAKPGCDRTCIRATGTARMRKTRKRRWARTRGNSN